MTTARRATRRAFTLLELMLALALASIVAMSAFGLFEVMRRSERRQVVRMGEADEIARTYKAMERAFRTMVMSDSPMPGDEKVIQERLRSFERAVDNDDPDPPLESDEPEPRLILRPDPTSPLLEVEVEGRRSRMKAQVMELALRSPPVLGARPDSRIFERGLLAGTRGRAAEARRVSDRAEGEEEPLDEEEPLIAPGVRGVFELVPDGVDPLGSLGPNTGLEGWKPRESSGQGWTLWWRELPPPPPEETRPGTDGDREDAPRRSREEIESEQLLALASARRVPLMTGLRWIRWEVYRGKRFDTRCRATWVEELPGFVKVAFETVEGRKENWMFEVGWTMGPEPGTEISRGSGRTPPGIDPRGGVPVRSDRPAAIRGRNRTDGDTPK
jgi:prepilin-type N-terminal cleavage/methylation domain-containing protein